MKIRNISIEKHFAPPPITPPTPTGILNRYHGARVISRLDMQSTRGRGASRGGSLLSRDRDTRSSGRIKETNRDDYDSYESVQSSKQQQRNEVYKKARKQNKSGEQCYLEKSAESMVLENNILIMDVEEKNSLNTTHTFASVEQLIKAQNFNGSFSISALKLIIPSLANNTLITFIPNDITAVNSEKLEAILITVVVCNCFAIVYAKQKILWTLIVKKARAWVQKELQAHSIPVSVDWDSIAIKFLNTHGIS